MCTATGLTAKKRLVRAFFWFVATRRSRNRFNDDFGRNKGLTAHNYNIKSPPRYPELGLFFFFGHTRALLHQRSREPLHQRATLQATASTSVRASLQTRSYCSRALYVPFAPVPGSGPPTPVQSGPKVNP